MRPVGWRAVALACLGALPGVGVGCSRAPAPRIAFQRLALGAGAEDERVLLGSVVGDGFVVGVDQPVEVTCTVPPGGALRFRALASGAEVRVVHLRIDGRPALALSAPATSEPARDFHVVALEAGQRRLRFELPSGAEDGSVAILAPLLGPLEIGSYGQRPWGAGTPPDLVLFLADTFRADNLAAYGGDATVAPFLNRLATRARLFREARSPSVWTLPSHASMFTGLFPLQHGAVLREGSLSTELETIAELLAAAGYRTGAVTDAAFVSRDYRMDQGFGTFVEHTKRHHSLARTLEEASAFLERDDGRPVFLFVHTYRTHAPYRTGAEESVAALQELERRTAPRLHGKRGEERRAELEALAQEQLALYRRGAQALDASLASWFSELEARGLLERGLFVFTSDHGEEFLEHGRRRHGGMPHDEKTRIPLLLVGGSLTSGQVPHGATLMDLPPTLAAWAGLAPSPGWVGQDLVSLEQDRPCLSYNGDETGQGFLAVVEGRHKIFTLGVEQNLAGGQVHEAFDLERDPGEQTDRSSEPWAGQLARRVAPLWAHLSQRLVGASSAVELSPEAREDLRKLGYFD